MSTRRVFLIAFGALVLGGLLIKLGLVVLGTAVLGGTIPTALVIWMLRNDQPD